MRLVGWLVLALVCANAAECREWSEQVKVNTAYPGAIWRTRAPEEVGLERAQLDALRDFVGGCGCVVRHGYMVYAWGDQVFLKVYGVTYDTVDAKLLHPQLTDILQCQDNPTFMVTGTNREMGRLGVSVRDFARLGLLYLRHGNWKGHRLISAKHVKMAVTSPLPSSLPDSTEELAEMIPGQRTIGRVARPQKQGAHSGSYSWLWWVNGVDRDGKRRWPDAPLDTYGAFGKDGNAMIVIPSLDLVASWSSPKMDELAAQNEGLQLVVESVRRKLTTQGNQFFLDGQPFKLWGIRTASATKDAAQTDHLIVQLDWKLVPKGNSGVLYHVSEEPVTAWHYAPEVQILDNPAYPICLQDHTNGVEFRNIKIRPLPAKEQK